MSAPSSITRIAAGVDGYPEGRDAAALGAALARVTGAELMLVAVYLDPIVLVPNSLSRKTLRAQAENILRDVRDAQAPGARILAEADLSVPRALHRVVHQHHRDLLVVGSSRDASDGRVRIAKRTRQLLGHFEYPLAIATRGVHTQPPMSLRKVGVGYDGGAEAALALALAGSIAAAAGAELEVRGAVDDRVPMLLRSALAGLVATEWSDAVFEQERLLHEQILAATDGFDTRVTATVLRGRPADALLALSEAVDLLVIGSRRWGPAARVLLGSTGEALLQGAACSVLTVPRPED
jgi:nucleotide-binding universal stress UspA family protein